MTVGHRLFIFIFIFIFPLPGVLDSIGNNRKQDFIGYNLE
jgi:hypothetical protein